MSGAIYALLIGGVLAAVTGFLVVQNRRTPVPEGCENLKPDCRACGIMDCAVRQEGSEEKGKDAETK